MTGIRVERIREGGTAAIIISEAVSASDGTFTLRRFDYGTDHLGPGGWVASPVVLTPLALEPSPEGLRLILGAEVTNHIEFGTPVEIALANGQAKGRVSWPDIPYQAAGGAGRIRLGAGRPQPAAAAPPPTPAPKPAPPPKPSPTPPPEPTPAPEPLRTQPPKLAIPVPPRTDRVPGSPPPAPRSRRVLAFAALAVLVISTGAVGAWLWFEKGPSGPSTAIRDCPDCPELVVIAAGHFTMGSPVIEAGRDSDEGPAHSVAVPAPLAVGRFKVTRIEFQHFVTATGYRIQGCKVLKDGFQDDPAADWHRPGFDQSDRDPAVCVSWNDAQAYVSWLKSVTGKPYRLLTEAEWEYAARAGTATPWFWGERQDDACAHANLADRTAQIKFPTWTRDTAACEDGFIFTNPVDRFPANAFNLSDMAGNAFEWVEDCYHPNYTGAPATADPWREGGDCAARVIRGGAWTSAPKLARAAARGTSPTADRLANIGFRVARPWAP